MRFVLKAIFFLAVVAAFIPRQPTAEAAPQPTPAVALDAEAAAGDFCERKPAVCQAAEESAFALKIVGGMAVAQARHVIAEAAAETPTDAAATGETPATEDVPAS